MDEQTAQKFLDGLFDAAKAVFSSNPWVGFAIDAAKAAFDKAFPAIWAAFLSKNSPPVA